MTALMTNQALPKTQLKHILCDLDGTLIYSGDARVHLTFFWKTVQSLKRHQGLRAAIRTLNESRSILKIPSVVESNFERLIQVFQKNLKLNYAEAIEEMKISVADIFPTLKSHFGEIKGAAEFVSWASAHYDLTLATNPVWSIDLVKLRMRWGGINPDFFKSITTSDRMHSCKPTREYYREILLLENWKAEDCLLIGNERAMDLPATRVGIAVFLIRPKHKELICIETPSSKSPGAWSGTYQHLQDFLETNQS